MSASGHVLLCRWAAGLIRRATDFTNVLSKSQIERLAEADEHELVREVQVRCRCSPTHWRRS